MSKNDGKRAAFKEDLQGCIPEAVQETCSSEMLGGQGADFLRGGPFWSTRSSGLLGGFGMTSAAVGMTWHHFFVAGAALLTDGVEITKCFGTMPPTQHSTFHV